LRFKLSIFFSFCLFSKFLAIKPFDPSSILTPFYYVNY